MLLKLHRQKQNI